MVEVLNIKNADTQIHIYKCLSSSQVCGKELRESHYYLGRQLGKQIVEKRRLKSKKMAVLIMMRAGLPFGLGIADVVDEDNDVTILFSTPSNNNLNEFETIIVVDAVINTGKTIIETLDGIDNKKVIVATNVISNQHLDNLKDFDIFATRISEHSFKGEKIKMIENGKGPDTGERLFSNSFFK